MTNTPPTESDRLNACVSEIRACLSDINTIYDDLIKNHAPNIKRVMDTMKVNRKDAIRWLSENHWDAGRAIAA